MSGFKSKVLSVVSLIIVVCLGTCFGIALYNASKRDIYRITLLTNEGDTILYLETTNPPIIPSDVIKKGDIGLEMWIEKDGGVDVWTNREDGGWIRK